jgi:DNA-binding transcriptional LysR family regulator
MNEPPQDLASLDRILLLQTFMRVAQAGSFSAAALQLGMSQPTVSRRLQQLEGLLGVRLLQRSTRGLQLTEEGQRALAQAQVVLEGWQALAEELGHAGQALSGPLRVRVPHAFGQRLLVAPLADFMQRHPRVQVDWMLQDALPDFSREAVDCSLIVGPVERPDLVAVPLAEVPRVLVAAPALAQALPQGWEQGPAPALIALLQAQPWLALTTYYREQIELRSHERGEQISVPLRPRLGTDSLFALRDAAQRGLGLAVVSHWAVIEDLAQGRLQRLLPAWCAMPLPISLVYPSRRLQPARLRAFVSLMREVVPGLPGMRAIGAAPG